MRREQRDDPVRFSQCVIPWRRCRRPVAPKRRDCLAQTRAGSQVASFGGHLGASAARVLPRSFALRTLARGRRIDPRDEKLMCKVLAVLLAGRIRIAVVGAIGSLSVLPAAARADVLRPAAHCQGAGGLTDDRQWQTSAPFLISLSRHTAANIAQRAGYFEGKPVTETRFVPCAVAESVAIAGLRAWANWNGNDGWVGVTLGVATGRPYLGRFYCTGKSTNSGGAVERCKHRANVHAGRIVVRFTIQPTSGY